MKRAMGVLALVGAAALAPNVADAFCGFYVGGADAKLFNDATQVVLMREGTRTVLSMQNSYKGPPENFAMVIPVPVVLQKENVKTLPHDVFDRIDQLSAPRLVEYWEQDPCPKPIQRERLGPLRFGGIGASRAAAPPPSPTAPAVKIEAQFEVGEYEIVVLSAKDSMGLDTWLRQQNYKIPAGAEPYLRPYVQMGMKFFVARVDVNKVKFERIGNGPEQAILSPLRFHYDSDLFNLPIRLGLVNSAGTQDLIVHILARGQRYEAANYDNIAVATNLDVQGGAKDKFGAFYAALFDKALEQHPHGVVTEYAWSAQSCDPCPTPPLQPGDLLTLGADVLPSVASQSGGPSMPPAPGGPVFRGRPPPWGGAMNGFVITRLHARYTKDNLGEDLFFRAAPPIVGGREMGDGQHLEQGARPDSQNNFQARYVIRHPWTGAVACKDPRRGIWGGPPGNPWGNRAPLPAAKIAYAPRGGVQLAALVKGAIPEENLLSSAGPTPYFAVSPDSPTADAGQSLGQIIADAATDDASVSNDVPPNAPSHGGCAGCDVGSGGTGAAAGLFAAVFAFTGAWWRRRKG